MSAMDIASLIEATCSLATVCLSAYAIFGHLKSKKEIKNDEPKLADVPRVRDIGTSANRIDNHDDTGKS